MQLPPVVAIGLRILDKATIPFNAEDSAQQLREFIDYFRQTNAAEQQQIRDVMATADYSDGRLIWYAQWIASEAIRTGSAEEVRRGLTAVVLGGMRGEVRDTAAALCMLHHSAGKLGADPESLFKEAARLGTHKVEDSMLKYLAYGDKRLEAMWLKEGTGLDGQFKYIVEPPRSPVRPRTR